MKTMQTWLDEYGVSHQNSTNKFIHWICVPVIFFSICGLFYGIKLPFQLSPTVALNFGFLLALFAFIYYFILSWKLSIGMLLFELLCLHYCNWIEITMSRPLWQICLILFVLAWIGQFYGHKIEGKKPSFLKDIQFLMIGPAWLMSFIYKRLGISI